MTLVGLYSIMALTHRRFQVNKEIINYAEKKVLLAHVFEPDIDFLK